MITILGYVVPVDIMNILSTISSDFFAVVLPLIGGVIVLSVGLAMLFKVYSMIRWVLLTHNMQMESETAEDGGQLMDNEGSYADRRVGSTSETDDEQREWEMSLDEDGDDE
jgi:hypothetical protein